MCKYNLSLNDELVQRTRQSFANEADMTAWLQRQVEALLIEYNTTQQIPKSPIVVTPAEMMQIVQGAKVK
ncbi:MAG: hypothetical protein IKP02_09615 [Paludibacteraceae bacterium]|nr:hypothetical protein [Paludibacteraceae bacterium]